MCFQSSQKQDSCRLVCEHGNDAEVLRQHTRLPAPQSPTFLAYRLPSHQHAAMSRPLSNGKCLDLHLNLEVHFAALGYVQIPGFPYS